MTTATYNHVMPALARWLIMGSRRRKANLWSRCEAVVGVQQRDGKHYWEREKGTGVFVFVGPSR